MTRRLTTAERLERLERLAHRLFPRGAHLVAVVASTDEPDVHIAAHLPQELHRALMRDVLASFRRDAETVITTIRIAKEKPAERPPLDVAGVEVR